MKEKVFIELSREVFHKDAADMLSEVADLVFEPLSEGEFRREIVEASAMIILSKYSSVFICSSPGIVLDRLTKAIFAAIFEEKTPKVALDDAVAEIHDILGIEE